MKCLSIRQPFASLIFDAIYPTTSPKTIETRVWPTLYRGPVLILASAKFHDGFVLYQKQGNKQTSTTAVSYKDDNLPTRMAIGVVDLVDCRPMTPEDEVAACCEIYPGAFSWVFENPRKIKPFPMRGKLRLWDYTGPQIEFV